MNMKDLLKKWNNTILENNIHRFINGALVVAVLTLSILAFTKDTVVVLIPPTLDGPVSVARNQADVEYKKSWSLYIAMLIGNVTPGNVDMLKTVIEPLLTTNIFQTVMEDINTASNNIKADRITRRFEIKQVLYEDPTDKVFVNGISYVKGVSGAEKSENRTIEVGISFSGHKPKIYHIESYADHPRLRQVIERMERREEQERAQKRRVGER